MRLSEARLEAPDVGALVYEADPCGGGFAQGGQVGVPKGRPALPGRQLCGVGRVCRVEECAARVRCSFLPAEGGVEPARTDSEVVCYLLWCRLRPRVRRRGCCSGGRELWVWDPEVTVVEVVGEKDVAGRHAQAAPSVAQGRAVGGRGALPVAMAMVQAWLAESAMLYPPRWSRRASLSGPKKLGWLAGGGARLGLRATRTG